VTATLNGVTQVINGNGQHIKGSITQDVKAIESFTFEIDPTNAGFDLIQSRKTRIKCVNDRTGRVEFNGRVLLSEEKMDSKGAVIKTVTCEGMLGILHDTVQPYKAEELYTPLDFLEMVLNNHNEQVEEDKFVFIWDIPNIEIPGTGYIYKGLQYQTTFETIKTKLLDVYGGELELIDPNDGVFYLHYVKQRGETRSTVIELGSNMQDASREVSPLNIVTRVYPLGTKLKQYVQNEDGSVEEVETEERLTLVGYVDTDGTEFKVPWVDDAAKIEALGIVCGVLDCPDITEQSNLYRRAREFMAEENRLQLSHTLTAIDLRELGHDIDSINCGDSYRVRNTLIGLDEVLRVVKKTFDINTPYKGSITIGEKTATLSNVQATETEHRNQQLQQLVGAMQAISNASNAAKSKVEALSASLELTVSGIVSEALASYITIDEREKITEEIVTKVSQSAGEIRQDFSKDITKVTEDLNGLVSSEFEELKAYIRYYMNDKGQPVIELGKEDSGVISRIVNDRFSIIENDIELFYAYNNRLQATDITILRRLMVSGYAIDPVDDGSVSVFKVGG
jgi:hypothetical protein